MESTTLRQKTEPHIIGCKRKAPLSFSQQPVAKSQRNNILTSPRHLPELAIDQKMYIESCMDNYFRTMRNPDIASHVLIVGNTAHFYTPPLTEKYQYKTMRANGYELSDFEKYFFQVPKYTLLQEIYQTGSDPAHPRYIGLAENGLKLYGLNSLNLTLNAQEFDTPIPAKMVSFYPLESWQKEPYWGERAKINALFSFPHCDSNERAIEGQHEREKELRVKKKLEQFGTKIKAIDDTSIDLESIMKRKKIIRRNPDQNTVMGRSAVQEVRRFLQTEFAPYLVKEVREFLERGASAPLKGKGSMWLSQWRDEWLHLLGFGCADIKIDPQVKENLGAAAKSVNTEQMIAEYIIQGLGALAYDLGYTNSDLRLQIKKSFFEMLPTTDIISYMSFHTRIELPVTGRSIETHQQFSPLQPPPIPA